MTRLFLQQIPRISTVAALAVAALLAAAPAHAGRNRLSGQVLDRNGEAVERAVVSLEPGNVQLVTDSEGRFTIDYLRDESGERSRLLKKTKYTFDVYKPGFHTFNLSIYYKKGEVTLEPVMLAEDTVDIQDIPANLDPGAYGDPTHSAGANYEGQ